ncbi:hypothetical protein RhiirA4_458124 [Rhizophagus irregularis]|uniref:Uncharacterized protein n=1 Tax=Rhizophagus irregularis TaxID=588596 RepID=A0A2I1GBI5_9GLOM|nr:hypothetical protein RhiirA4_458124 [Rhizophagus irregularis]
MSKKLQKDNITTDEVVKSINDHRKVQRKEIKKVPYKKFESPPLSSPLNQRKAIVDSKYEELREFFEKCGEEMEWEKIEEQTDKDLKGFENIMQAKEIYNLFNLRVIQAAESHDVIQRYMMTLQSELKKRIVRRIRRI